MTVTTAAVMRPGHRAARVTAAPAAVLRSLSREVRDSCPSGYSSTVGIFIVEYSVKMHDVIGLLALEIGSDSSTDTNRIGFLQDRVEILAYCQNDTFIIEKALPLDMTTDSWTWQRSTTLKPGLLPSPKITCKLPTLFQPQCNYPTILLPLLLPLLLLSLAVDKTFLK